MVAKFWDKTIAGLKAAKEVIFWAKAVEWLRAQQWSDWF
jgi:hypothetical protein